MILVTHKESLALEQDTFVFASSAKVEHGDTLVLRDPLQRVVKRFGLADVIAVFKREGPNGPRVALPMIDAEVTMPAPFMGLDGETAP